MVLGGQGPWAITVMWLVTVVAFVFVALRHYTRRVLVQNVAIDDHVYNFAFALLVCYTVATTIAAHYGFGQNMADITDVEDLVHAILFEAIGQTFAVVGMAVAKWSLGLFLLRLVTKPWQKMAIWITMVCLMAASISTCFVFWLQCTPPAYLYDRRIPDGYCHINSTPVSLTLCILCVIADFFFAIFPWTFLWNLQMNQREKIVIAGSLSLGLIAGACGIKRTVEVPNLSSDNYLYDTVGLIVWSAAEIAVTMICIGIPVCRPLYKRWLDKLSTNRSGGASGYRKQEQGQQSGSNNRPFGMQTFGGGAMPGAAQPPWRPETTEGESSGDDTSENGVKGAAGGAVDKGLKQQGGNNGSAEARRDIATPFSEAIAVGGAGWNGSEEEILGSEFRADDRGPPPSRKRGSHPDSGGKGHGHGKASIQVTEEWRVDRSKV
ncbi:hypothetical protein C8A00DRAFT_47148 [Chaetomidium leptoderma]|uniref:Rhodopsin domain-containing protein n=1 Tax=Chaetomidium leptoderma TaxID=669021 RepID=A0AAN6VCY3_9PEZI|nr:hypothetical protein C8A00DRAFT_47148 [Chaetomidium leptoderma]